MGEGWRRGQKQPLLDAGGSARSRTSLLPRVEGASGDAPRTPDVGEEEGHYRLRSQSHCAPDVGEPGGAPTPTEVRGCEASAGGVGAPLTHPVLNLGRKPVRGPLVELRGAHASGGGETRRTDSTRGAPTGVARARGPPPPLIGPWRTCPYKARTRRIPAATDFLSPLSCPDPRPGEALHPLGPGGKLTQRGAGESGLTRHGTAALASRRLSHPFWVSVYPSAL